MLNRCFKNGQFNEEEFAILIKEFRGKILGYVSNFYLPGGDRDDLIQWGIIGLYRAVKTFDESKGKSFTLFADINIKSTIKSAITAANRKRHKALNSAISFCPSTAEAIDNDEWLRSHVLAREEDNPLNIMLNQERAESLGKIFSCILSRNEGKIMELYLEGYQQRQIAYELRLEKKVVDNAIQRARKKLITHFTYCQDVV